MGKLKHFAKSALARSPYRIIRARQLNRFQCIAEGLQMLAKFGFNPTRIVDVGANFGEFALLAQKHFPRARIDMVEPQPACAEALGRLSVAKGFAYHRAALVAAERSGKKVEFIVAPNAITTGERMSRGDNGGSDEAVVEVDAVSLDDLLLEKLGPDETVLIKLDLEGHELPALMGATSVLR